MRIRYLPIMFITGFTILAFYVSGEKLPGSFETNKEMIVFRKMGHEILLNAGDSISRILPIKKISEQEFSISFEKPVALVPDSVVSIFKKIGKENKLPEYSVNITDCQKNEIVYGFALSPHDEQNVVPCLGRRLPKDCYKISLLFPTAKRAGVRNWYFAGAMIILAIVLYFSLKVRDKTIPAPAATPDKSKGTNSAVQIGKYFFYPSQQILELDGEKTTLTHKESRLLHVLSASPNTMIERELLQKEVWENEGVIVTRSLDMFISKLRKKLSGDTNIKIVNAHGKGYKLEFEV